MHRKQTVWSARLLMIFMVLTRPILAEEAPRFAATGKLLVDWAKDRGAAEVSDDFREEFFATQFEILTSKVLKHQALERVHGLHPELKDRNVKIAASKPDQDDLIKVTATSDDPTYAMKYLDALMDEYMAFRVSMVEKSVGTAANKVIAEVLSREKEVKEKKRALDTFLQANQLDTAEKKVQRGILEDDLKRTGDDYKVWKQTLESLVESLKKGHDDVVIIERPASAEKVH